MFKSNLFDFSFFVSDSLDSFLFSLFELFNFVEMKLFHFLCEVVKFLPVFLSFFHSDFANFEISQSTNLFFEVISILLILLSFILKHSFLKGFERHSSLNLDSFHETIVNISQFLIKRHVLRAHIFSLTGRTCYVTSYISIGLNLINNVKDQRCRISHSLYMVIMLKG